jgi:hypothetical protein
VSKHVGVVAANFFQGIRKYPTDKQAYWIHTLYRQHCRKLPGKAIAKLELQGAGW